jgi:hypothetical protein
MLLLAALLTAPCNIHPQYAVQARVTHATVVRQSSGYLASAQVRYTLRVTKEALLPSVDDGLMAHVQGHMMVARRVVRSSGGTVRANGASEAQARARLNQTLARMSGDLQNELNREEAAYDNVTAYGRSQSQGPSYGFPGGSDIVNSVCAEH